MFVERYSHVMHLVSSLRGNLREDVDCFDALAPAFRGVRFPARRRFAPWKLSTNSTYAPRHLWRSDPYLDFSGNLDSCIAIRTMVVKKGVAYVQAGAGLVADSVPEKEYGRP